MQVESTSKPVLTLDEANEDTINAFDQSMNKYSQQEKLVSIPFSYVNLNHDYSFEFVFAFEAHS